MPKFDNMQTLSIQGANNFQFSAVRPDSLGATEYTLVTIVVDVSASVASFSDTLLEAIKAVVRACQRSPRADNLLVRLLTFNNRRQEIHGFVPLRDIDPDAYKPLKCSGATALYDSVFDAVGASNQYAQNLSAQNLDVNAAVYVLTDGMDNNSGQTPQDIAREVRKTLKQEHLESLTSVLVGLDTQDAGVAAYLQLFKDEAELGQYVDVADANPDNLARLSNFVTQSISLQSQLLGTGMLPKSLSF